nr:hypothetical protein [Casimicrobium sp.]
MVRFLKSPGALFVQSATLAVGATALVASATASQTPALTLATAQQKLAAMSVPFVPNAGQWDARAAFGAKTFAGTLFVTNQGELVYSLPGKPKHEATPSRRLQGNVGADSAALPVKQPGDANSSPTNVRPEATPSRRLQKSIERSPGWALSETLVDASGQARTMTQSTLTAPAGLRPMEGKVSYAIGSDATKHATSLNTYERVNLGDMYPGINVQLRATGNNVEKIFTVAPKHDPKQIHIQLAGAQKLEIGTEGELIAHTGNGAVAFTAPIAFQETADGGKEPVPVSYALNAATHTYGFALGDYDRARPLVIDPLLKTTYVGGSGSDAAYAMAVHPLSGDVYIAGFTDSSANNLTGVAGSYDASYNGGTGDAFVARLSSDLTRLVAATYLGGPGHEIAKAIAIHPHTGDVYIAGYTASTTGFPAGVSAGVQPTSGGGAGDAFVAQFSADLKTLRATTYLGGDGTDSAQGIAIHPVSGEVYVVGDTQQSGSNTFPVSSGALQTAYGDGGRDAFIS